jgi:hypothetical protein
VEPNFVERTADFNNVKGFLNTMLRTTNRYMVTNNVGFFDESESNKMTDFNVYDATTKLSTVKNFKVI